MRRSCYLLAKMVLAEEESPMVSGSERRSAPAGRLKKGTEHSSRRKRGISADLEGIICGAIAIGEVIYLNSNIQRANCG